MKLQTIIISTFIVSLFSSCGTAKDTNTSLARNPGSFFLESQFKDYIPISPIEFEQEVEIFNSTADQFENVRIKRLAADKPNLLKFLPNETVYALVSKQETSGELKFSPATVTAEAGSYTVTLDYGKFTTLKIMDDGGSCAGFAKVGVGLRVTAKITTFDANVDISSLFGLGLAAKTNRLKGQLSVDIIGMESGKITDLIILPVDISEASIQTALQSVAAIKSKIYDKETNLFPQIIAIKKDKCSISDILNNIELPGLTPYKKGVSEGRAMRQLENALIQFKADKGRYPADLKELNLDSVLKVFVAGELSYRRVDDGFTLRLAGADGKLNTSDDKIVEKAL